MSGFFDLLGGLLQVAFFAALAFGGVMLFGYNKLRAFSESVKEAWSNIGVVIRKQASLINQLIDVVKGYQESEKLVMLKVSDDSTVATMQSMYQQSGTVLATVAGVVQRFPELKANEQYHRLIDSIQQVESQLGLQRAKYNSVAKSYNVIRTSVPHVFYARWLGFVPAPYLELGASEANDIGALKSFVNDDGERLNALLADAGNKAMALGKGFGAKAIEQGRQLIEVAQSAVASAPDDEFHYIDRDGNPQGPVSVAQFEALQIGGSVGPETMVLRSGEKNWRRLAETVPRAGRDRNSQDER